MTDHHADEIQRIRVVNRNDFTISDRFDGVPVVFEPNKVVDLAPEVAEHIFAYPGDTEVMYRHMAKRWGWNLPANPQTGFFGHLSVDAKGVPLWVRQCERVEITTTRFELRPVGDPSRPIPADDGADDERVLTAIDPEVPRANEGRRANRKKKRPISQARSQRMKRIWAEKRAAAQQGQPMTRLTGTDLAARPDPESLLTTGEAS